MLKCGPMPTVKYTILATASSIQPHSATRNQFAPYTDKFFDSPYSLNDTRAPFQNVLFRTAVSSLLSSSELSHKSVI
jgi:hypothetical protein